MGWVKYARLNLSPNSCFIAEDAPKPMSELSFDYEWVWQPEENPPEPHVDRGFPEDVPDVQMQYVCEPDPLNYRRWRTVGIIPQRRKIVTTWIDNTNGQQMGRATYQDAGVRRVVV